MLRADRLQGTVRKELLKASKASGQTNSPFPHNLSLQMIMLSMTTPQMIMLLLVQVKPPPLQ